MDSRLELRNYRMKLIVCMTREILKMLNHCAVDYPTFPVHRPLLPPHRDPGGLLSRIDKPPDIWNTHGTSGNYFVNPPASSSLPYPGELNPWISNVTEDTSCTRKFG